MSQSVSENVVAGRYRLIEPIGLGGMAEVHRAWDTLLRRHVAVKLFQPGFDPEAARRFDNEVRVLAGLSHPGLVSVYDADTGADAPFVVLRLVEGETLRERISRGPQPLDQVRRLGTRLADALAHVHSRGLVHRDVKPSNILLDHEDNPYLADFGLVHLTGATRLTRTDQLVGTAAYLSPEQVLGRDVDQRADVYALGLVLLECLTGRREYGGGDVEAAIARLHRPPVLPEDLPADVELLLSRMTATSPDERPSAQDCSEVLGAGVPDVEIPLARSGDDAVPVAAATVVDAPALDATVADAEVVAASPTTADTTATDTTAADTAATAPVAAPEVAPRRERRMPRKALVVSAGALIGAIAVTTAATSLQEATSSPGGSPATSTAPPASSAPPAEPGSPQRLVNPQQVAVTTHVTVEAPQPTTAPQEQGATSTTAPTTTQPPVTEPVTETSAPAVTTTPPQQTTDPVVPTTDNSGGNSETGEPTAAPTEED